MRRPMALILVPVTAFALAACSTGPGAESTEATMSLHVERHGPTAGSGLPESGTLPIVPAPSVSAPTAPPEVTASGDTGGTDTDAAVIGQWGGATEGSPVLWFAPKGRFNGHDGCNSLTGTWAGSGQGIELRDVARTLIGCPGMDTWLSRARFVTVDGETLRVTDKDGKGIGTLPRINVAG
ncbi:META domain-containing protein [Paeniglutamicibacter sp. MACA_103]|uniref:META domain-containing protein n=1 Tax=Paeniglutamicibacter sp. MACA_103 TaxID=3377337 RepID=UPI003893C369